MGMFDKNIEKSGKDLYSDVKQYLSTKDGKKHIVMVNTMSKLTTNGMECESKYTLQIDSVISEMQQEGYEILDVKMEISQTAMGNAQLIRTLIIYK